MSQLQGSPSSEDGRDEPPQMHARKDAHRSVADKQRNQSSAPAGIEAGDAASTLSSSPREPQDTPPPRDEKRTSSSSAITAELPNVESTRAAAATGPPATHDTGDEVMSADTEAAAPCASSSPTSKTTTATRMEEAADAAAFATGIAAASAAPQLAKASSPSAPAPLRSPPSAASQLDESPSASASPAPASQTNTTTAEAAVKRWKENKEYLKLQRDMGRVLASMDRTPVADWATQASLLAQLQRIVQGAKDIVGAVELPDGDRFARSLWRAMSPQTVVGVQRKALEVLQSYLEYVNPAYPMTKDLPHFLPALLELLPQATMQVKSDVLELLDRAVVRRMPPIALRSCAEGLLAALLSCLEESETSAMYRRAMALLEYVHGTLQCDTSLDQRAGVLRGGQVLPAYTWLLVRDAASVRCPALLVMKRLIAQASLPVGGKAAVTCHSDETAGEEESALLSSPEQNSVPVSTTLPDWVGGDVQVVVSGLFNSLQDTQEKVHRLALDVLALVCPLGGRGVADAGGGGGAAAQTAVAAACLYESSVGISPAPSPTSSGPLTLPPPDSWVTSSGGAAGRVDVPPAAAQAELFSFEMKALLAAAAVQLLGTRHSTPSVTRRILQWLTVDPGCEAGERSGQWGGAAEDVATAGDDASPSSSSHSYVRDVTSFLLAQGFHMVVRHWQASWTNRFAEGGAAGSRTPIAQRHLSSELSALQRTARSLVGAAAPRLSSATSIAAALSGGVGGGMTAAAAGGEATTVTSSATSTAVGAVATPLVWLRALMLLFRYRSPSSGGAAAQAGDAGACVSPNTLDSPRHTVSDGASEPDTSFPFALYLVPLVLPSLSCLLEDVPSVLSRASLDSVKDARVPGSGKGINGSPEEEAWCAEVRALLRVLPWTGFAKLDVLGVQAVEKLVRPLLAETSRDGGNGGGVEPLQRRIQQYLHEAFTLVRALEPSLMDATTEQPVAAQEYVGASLAWSDTVASLLSDVLDALTHAVTSRSVQEGLYISLFVSTANGLLRVVVQRMQQLMEPMFDAVLATANATATAVVGADFFASFVSAVDSGVLRRLREATVRTTQGLLFAPHSDSGTPVDNTSRSALHSLPDDQRAEVQKLLSRMHHTTLRFTAFLAQLHLRCQQHAVAGMLLDSASEDGAGSRERELARETASWLRCLCRACAAAACNASLFFTRAVRLVLDVLLRARGSLLPAATYHMLEPNCLASGGLNDTVAFAEKFVLAPVVRSLWEGCRSVRDTAATAFLAQSSFASAEDCCADTAGVCGASLLVLIAVSPACARCLDVCILESSVDAAIPRLVGLHRQLVDLRAQQRRGHVSSAAVPESAVVAELQDPGVLFLGLLTLLSCVSVGSGGSDRDGAAESTRQLARAYLSHATVRDLSSVLLPLFFSFLCPLVLPIPPVTASMETGAGGATPHYASAGPAFSALTLTVLLPSSTHPGTKVRCADEAQRPEAARTYRTLEAAELVHHIFALLQLPTALAWLRQAMRTPTPNSLRVLLRGLEAQSFMAPDGRTSATAAALAREGPSDSLLAATALLLLNLSRQSLLSLHWSVVHRRDQAGGAGGGGVRGGIASASSGLGSPTHAEFPPSRHHSILLDALGCLNRMLEGSQTGPRTQPCRTAQHTWQFTAMQLLPLLRLAVQANLHTAQAMLLDHITGVVVYVDDVTASSSSSSGGAGARATVFGAPYLTAGGGGESGVTSRHWHPHALLRIGAAAAGHPDDALLLSGAPASGAHGSAATATTTTAAWVGESERTGGCGTPVTDDLQRAPPAVLSNKLLYAMIGEAVEHALGALCGTEEAAAATADREVDTLVRWLRFYCDVLPYLYRELVPSSEVVLDVLLSALETTTPPCALSTSSAAAEAAASAPRLPAALARVRCVCYATLAFLLRFLFSVARAADVEDYEAAVKAKEAMSWIASTFSQEDPVARARSTTMWSRSPVLAPLRGALGRLVSAAVPGLCLGHTIHAPATNCTQSGPGHASAQPFTWGYDADAEEEVAMGWRDGPRSPQPPPAGPTEERREPARQLLILLSHSAGPQFVTAFVEHWCGAHASSTALWVFETAGQRQCRLRQVQRSRGHHCSRGEEDEEVRRTAVHEGSAGANAAMTAEVVRLRSAAWAAREVAQRAAGALLDDVGLSVAEVAMALGSLLREAIPKQLRSEQQSAQKSEEGSATRAGRGGGEGALTSLSTSLPPSHVAQVLYFLDTLVESVCTARPGGLTDRDAEAILALTSEVVSQGPPDSLAVCCVFHTVYCVIAYARGETGGTESERSNAVRGLSSSSPSPRTAASASKIYQSKDYSFTLCRLLEALSLNPAATHRSATLMLLQLLCQCFHAVLPSSLSWTDNPGRLVDAVTRVFQRTLLPTLRRGIASESEAEIVSNAPLVNACLRVLRAAINGFAPDQSFEKRVHRDIVTLVFSEHFFRYSRGSLHEWARLLRQLCAMDGDFHALMCERLVPSAGRLSTLMMSRETEALLRERALKCLAFYTYAVTATEDSPATSGATAASTGVATVVAAAAADNAGLGPAVSVVRHKELIHVLREQLTHTLQHFSPTTTPTVAEVDRKEVFVQPLRAAFFVFRVLLLCGIRESLAASLWPLVWPELLRALAIKPLPAVDSARSESAAVSVDAVQEVLRLQVEALKVLDADYTLYPAHAFSFRWLFTDDTALASVVALQQQQRYCRSRAVKKGVPHTPSPMSALLRAAVVRRVPLVSHLEVLHLLQKSPPVAAELHFDPTSLIAAVHEPRVDPPCDEGSSEGLAPVLATIQRCWPLSARPSAGDRGLRRPLFNLPSTHYARLDGVHRAAQAFSVLLQRVNGEALSGDEDVQRLMLAQRELGECVGFHNEVDVAFMQDLVEADLTMTDSDTML